MAALLLRALDQNFQAFERNDTFLAQIVLTSVFLVQIRNRRPIDPSAKYQPNWTKDKGSRISTWNNRENCVMTSHTHDSDDGTSSIFLMRLRDFVLEYKTY